MADVPEFKDFKVQCYDGKSHGVVGKIDELEEDINLKCPKCSKTVKVPAYQKLSSMQRETPRPQISRRETY